MLIIMMIRFTRSYTGTIRYHPCVNDDACQCAEAPVGLSCLSQVSIRPSLLGQTIAPWPRIEPLTIGFEVRCSTD